MRTIKKKNDIECIFADKKVSYEEFIEKLSTSIAMKLHTIDQNNKEISRRQAFIQFGRADVTRWIENGLLKPSRISPGKTRYKVTDLIKLSKITNNYLL